MSNKEIVQMIKTMEKNNAIDTWKVSTGILEIVKTTNVKNLSTYCTQLDKDCKADNVKGYGKSYMLGFSGIVEVFNKKFGVEARELWLNLWNQLGKGGIFNAQKLLKESTKVQLLEYSVNGLDDKKESDRIAKESDGMERIEREIFALLLESMPKNMRETAAILNRTKGAFDKLGNVKHTLLTAVELSALPTHCALLYDTLGLEVIDAVVTA